MSDSEPSRDEILDNSPEAVAMRRMRAARAEAAAKGAPPEPRTSRRRIVLGAAMGGIAAAGALSRLAGRRGP